MAVVDPEEWCGEEGKTGKSEGKGRIPEPCSVKHAPRTQNAYTDREIHRACLKPHVLNDKNNTERGWKTSGKISLLIHSNLRGILEPGPPKLFAQTLALGRLTGWK